MTKPDPAQSINDEFESEAARLDAATKKSKGNGGARDRAYRHRMDAANPMAPLRVLEPEKWSGQPVPQTRWIVHHVLPVPSVCTLGGHGETGKSILALQLGVARALGRDWLGFSTARGKTLIVSCEDPEAVVWGRIASILEHYGADFADLGDRLRIVDRVDLLNSFMDWENRWKTGEETALLSHIHNLALDIGADLIVVDSRYDVFAGEQNDTPQVHQFMTALRTVAVEIDGVVLILAHPSRTGLSAEGDGESGSVAWHNKVRSRLYLRAADKEKDGDCDRVLEHLKSNYGPKFEPLRLTWRDGAFAADRPATGVLASIEQSAAEKAFLEALAEAEARGIAVSHSSNASNYAPKVLREMPQATKFTRGDLKRAMQALFAARKIKVAQYGPPSNPKSKIARLGCE